MPFDIKKLAQYPTQPGVYLMKDETQKVIYVGKAKNLRQRIKQYFVPGRDGRLMVPYLTAKVESIDVIVVDSEKEALLVENTLIKKHRPKYNALLKDDKTYFSLMIDMQHRWPLVRVVRYKGLPKSHTLYFGPYTRSHAARQTLDLLRSLFPLRQCSDQELARRSRPCILYEMKRCVAPCVGKCTKEDYDSLVQHVVHFLQGDDTTILKNLKSEMAEAAQNLAFERAHSLQQIIKSLETTLEDQKVVRIENSERDVISLTRREENVVVAQLIFRAGKLVDSHTYTFSHNAQEDEELLTSFLLQHYISKEVTPREILLPIEMSDIELLELLISEQVQRRVHLLFPQRGEKRALLEMAEKNALSKLEREELTVATQEELLMQLEETFHLNNYPEHIECFDNSHLSGSEAISAMITYAHGEKDRKNYRSYILKQSAPGDDYGALKEVLHRRYFKAKEEGKLPQLILIDGGKGHLHMAQEILEELDISTIDLLAITKESGKHTRGITHEKFYITASNEPIHLKPHSRLLFFLQQVRDEAHRFAITFQKKRRGKKSMASLLDELPGIGAIKRERLLLHFKSVKRILLASEEELLAIKGLNKKEIALILELGQKLREQQLNQEREL